MLAHTKYARLRLGVASMLLAGLVAGARRGAWGAEPGPGSFAEEVALQQTSTNEVGQWPPHVAQGVLPRGRLRVHVGPVPPPVYGPADFLPNADYRSRGAYHVVETPGTVPLADSPRTMPSAADYRAWALQAFGSRRYADAARLLKHCLVEDERNGRNFLLLSHAQLAAGRYRAAADSLGAGLTLLDRSAWGCVVRNRASYYTDHDYDRQLERLSAFVRQNPTDWSARLLRGYHRMYRGQTEPARTDLIQVPESTPRAISARRLLDALDGTSPTESRLQGLTASPALPLQCSRALAPPTQQHRRKGTKKGDPPSELCQVRNYVERPMAAGAGDRASLVHLDAWPTANFA